MATNSKNSATLVNTGSPSGHVVISGDSPLRRLNYFDGKFLRAPDLIQEQQAMLNQVRRANQAGGAGIVYGYDCTLSASASLQIGGGFAIDHAGRILLLNNSVGIAVEELIEKSRAAQLATNSMLATASAETTTGTGFDDCVVAGGSPGNNAVFDDDLYLVTLYHSEAYCGQEDVYGQLCSEACASDSRYSHVVEGIEIRAVPLNLSVLLKQSSAVPLNQLHLRSRVAAAYFVGESENAGSHISASGLNSMIWCLGAEASSASGIPIAVLGRSGGGWFVDAWTARRERMDSPARDYWAGRMAMRPWNVFLAQVLQFQCQLRDCLARHDSDAPCRTLKEFDPCFDARLNSREAADFMRKMLADMRQTADRLARLELGDKTSAMLEKDLARLEHLYQRLDDNATVMQVPDRLLINCGIVELPSAGYLPVSPGSSLSINDQVRRLMGEGVDLRFCSVRPDYVPHALEEAQHMQRICLLQGIDDPDDKPRVDVLVPDGLLQQVEPEVTGTGYEMTLSAGGGDVLAAANKTVIGAAMRTSPQQKKAVDGAFAQSEVNFTQFAGPRNFIAGFLIDRDENEVDKDDDTELSGAARGETLDSGGSAFYFAGRMPTIVKRMVIADFEQRLQRSDALREFVGNIKTADPAKASEAAAKEKSKAAEEVVVTAAAAPMAEAPEVIVVTGTQASEEIEKPTSRGAERIFDMWLDLRSERDAFSLARGQFTAISAELTLMTSAVVADRLIELVLEITQTGSLTVESVLSTGSEPRSRCNINTKGALNLRVSVGPDSLSKTIPLNLNEQVIISRNNEGGARPTFRLDLPSLSGADALDRDNLDIDVGFRFARSWPSGDQASLSGAITYLFRYVTGNGEFRQEGELPLFNGEQRVNPEVLRAGNEFHDTSLTALREIGNALDDSGYADIRARLLFPPPKPAPEQSLIFGTRDWVLFHRRRDIACRQDQLPDVAARPLRYRMFYVDSLRDVRDMRLFARALATNDGTTISRYAPLATSIVEYEAGLQTVRSPHSSLRNSWRALVNTSGAHLMFGAIGSQGEALDEGEAMANMRLDSLSDVLAPVTPLDEDVRLITLQRVPDVLAEDAIDGVIVLAVVTAADVATVCQQVYRVQMDDFKLIEQFHAGLQQDYPRTLAQFEAQELGRPVQFLDQSADYVEATEAEALTKQWQEAGGGEVSYLFTLNQIDADGNASNPQPYSDQGQRIVATLQDMTDINSAQIGVPTPLQPCPGISVLVTRPELQLNRITLFGYHAGANAQPAILNTRIQEVIQANGFLEWLGSAEVQEMSLGIVNFDANPQADPSDLLHAKRVAESGGLMGPDGENVLFGITISKNGASVSDLETHKKWGDQVIQYFTSNDPAEIKNSSNQWNIDEDAAILIVAVSPLFFHVITADEANVWTIGSDRELITAFKEAIKVDDNGGVIKDEAYDNAVKTMVDNGETINNIEVVALTKAQAEAQKAEAEAMLVEMKASGVASESATISIRTATTSERNQLKKLGTNVKAGLIMTR